MSATKSWNNNYTPNGRQADSRCPTFYFLPKFRRVEPPKSSEKDFDKKISCCLVSEFNRAQENEGRGTAGAYTIRQWLKQHRPKVAIHPYKVDYCDFCKRMEKGAVTTTPNHKTSPSVRKRHCRRCSIK